MRPAGPFRLVLLGLLGVAAVSACGGHSGASARSSASSSSASASPSADASLAGGDEGSESIATAKPTPSSEPTRPTPVGVTERNAGSCPFIATDDAVGAEGNKISSVSVLVQGSAVIGCRFRFWCCDFHYTLEISSQSYPDATTAYNRMVRIGQAGGSVIGVPSLAPAVDGVLYQTSFYQPDGHQDWACSFASGRAVVTVKTDQNDTSQDALNVAKLIVSRFQSAQ